MLTVDTPVKQSTLQPPAGIGAVNREEPLARWAWRR
jgi:hypothetical protein